MQEPKRSIYLGALMLCTLCLSTLSVHPQNPGPGLQPNPETYRLGPDDVIDVIIAGVEELALQPDEKGITLGPDGQFMFPHVGVVQAQGRTCAEVAQTIQEALANRYNNFTVAVRVKTYNAQKINVIGAVNKPGNFAFRPDLLVRDVIALAEGPVLSGEGAASQMRARLVHSDGASEVLNLLDALQGAGEYGTRTLLPGDTLVIEQEATISVLGYVQQPGYFQIKDGTRLSEALAKAQGVLDEEGTQRRLLGDLSRVIINRPGEPGVIEVDFQGILDGEEDAGEDPVLQPGDMIYVPPSEQMATVVGYVRQPGKYSFRDNERVSDIIAIAGGEVLQIGAVSGSRGDLRRVVLTRSDGTRLVLDQSRKTDEPLTDADNPLLEAGDTVFVPEERIEVAVLGHVLAPGRYPLRPSDRVTDALGLAGGPLEPTEIPALITGADLAHSVLYRAGGEMVLLDLSYASATYMPPAPQRPDPTRADLDTIDNPILEHGDTLVIPEAENRVRVDGFVNRPGYFEFRPTETVSQAIAMAEGPETNIGSEYLAILRYPNGAEEQIDVRTEDRLLSPGLSIRVPYARYRVAVLGYVTLPGAYEWHEGDRVVDMVAQARGPIPPRTDGGMRILKGEYYRAILVRRAEGEAQYYDLDLAKYYQEGDLAANPLVQPDDVIIVPQKDKFNPQIIFQDLLALPGLFNAIFR